MIVGQAEGLLAWIAANYAAVSVLVLDSLNPERAHALFAAFAASSPLPSPSALAASLPLVPRSPVPMPALGVEPGDLVGLTTASLATWADANLGFVADAHLHVALVRPPPGADDDVPLLFAAFAAYLLHHTPTTRIADLPLLFARFSAQAKAAGWSLSRLALPLLPHRVDMVVA